MSSAVWPACSSSTTTSRRARLPRTYGVDDLPVIVQDERFDGAEFDHGHQILRDIGLLGDRIVVNGTLGPYLVVGDELVRLRLLNASTARVYDFGFADDRQFALVGDRRRAAAEAGRDEPDPALARRTGRDRGADEAGRADRAAQLPAHQSRGRLGGAFGGGDDSFDVLQLRAATTLRPSPALAGRLGTLEVPDGSDSVRRTVLRSGDDRHQRPEDGDGPDRRDGRPGHRRDLDRTQRTTAPRTTSTSTMCSSRCWRWTARSRRRELRGAKDTVFVPPFKTVEAGDALRAARRTRTLRTCTTVICCTTRTWG